MTAVAHETQRAHDLMERVETIASVAETLPLHDERRRKLLRVIDSELTTAPPLRARIAADILDLSEKTIRAWTVEGVLHRADASSPRLLLEARQVHHVLVLLNDLRAAGKTTGLLDEVHRRLVDETWLERTDLAASLEQMRRGEGTTRRDNAAP